MAVAGFVERVHRGLSYLADLLPHNWRSTSLALSDAGSELHFQQHQRGVSGSGLSGDKAKRLADAQAIHASCGLFLDGVPG